MHLQLTSVTVPSPSRLKRYAAVITRWAIITFVVFVITLWTGKYITENLLWKRYTATAEIEVLKVTGGQFDHTIDENYFESEYENLRSPDLLKPVIEQLGLDQAWAKRVYKSDEERLSMQEALAYMGHNLKIEHVSGGHIIKINFRSDDPKEAAAIANGLADGYKQKRDMDEDQRDKRGLDSLRQQIEVQKKIAEDARIKVEEIRRELSEKHIEVPSDIGPTSVERWQQDLESRQRDLLAAKEDYDARAVLYSSVIDLPDDKFIAALKNLVRSHQNITALQDETASWRKKLDDQLKSGMPQSDPHIIIIHKEIDGRERQLHDLVQGLRRNLKTDLEMAKSRVPLLQVEVDGLTVKLKKNPSSPLAPYVEARRTWIEAINLLDALNLKLGQDIEDLKRYQSPVRIVSRAEVPTEPSGPNKLACFFITVGVAALISLVVGCFVEVILLFVRAAEGEHS